MRLDDAHLERAQERAANGFRAFCRWRQAHADAYHADTGDWLLPEVKDNCESSWTEGRRLCAEALALEQAVTEAALRFTAQLEQANRPEGRVGQWLELLDAWRQLKRACKYCDQIETSLAFHVRALVVSTMQQIEECPLATAALGAVETLPAPLVPKTQHPLHPQHLWTRAAGLLGRIQRTMNESAERIEPGIGAFRRTRRRWVFAEALHRRASELVRQLFALLQDRTETIPLFYQPTYMTEEKTGNTAEYRQWLKTEEELRQQATQAAAFLLALSGDDALYAFVASEQDAVQHRTFMLPWLHNVE